ncbi:hypothetical protein EYB45_10800 [Erythrobacteraceae bacterium CFH 75059]|uniref:murein transglycosylase A n=1 Tax=Qipengyuania thermophila TaxID=2509361 RepID=UPI0010211B48|nr:MltA domain-containing protein [Qipengyuania thermophila]TCD01906.1 hypothetical protein EYB45_10800 [Erythrobacteraceae bacterium CFH 75059]
MNARTVVAVCAAVLLAGCVRTVSPAPAPAGPPPSAQVPAPAAARALDAPLRRGEPTAHLVSGAASAARALRAFRESCPVLLERTDLSGLTRPEDWSEACAAARVAADGDAAEFFRTQFDTLEVAGGAAFATGYFEPEIEGSPVPVPGAMAVYALPPDLVRAWPADTPPEQRDGRPPLGRYDENGRFVDYHDRAAIEDGALAGRGLELAWALDPVELFFLQIQGSGRLRMPDGSVMRIGYAGQNGHGYVAIGRLLRDRGLLGEEPGQYAPSMQGIMAYLRDHPEAGRALMRENPSWVFFRELSGDGPLGSIGVPVRPRVSVAVDPRFVPYGAPVWLDLDRDEADGLWVAQDTGGAIRGANRFDTFWGAGEDARRIAGDMSSSGRALVLLPRATVARLEAEGRLQ